MSEELDDLVRNVTASSVRLMKDGKDPQESVENSDSGVSASDIYKSAIDEYRFQAQFNWSRTQYLLAFNVAILTAGTAVAASQPGRTASLVFALGGFTSVMSSLAVRTQHDYYRAARDRLRRVETLCSIPFNEHVDTTSTLGRRKRLVSVNQIVYVLFAAIAMSNATGIALLLFAR